MENLREQSNRSGKNMVDRSVLTDNVIGAVFSESVARGISALI